MLWKIIIIVVLGIAITWVIIYILELLFNKKENYTDQIFDFQETIYETTNKIFRHEKENNTTQNRKTLIWDLGIFVLSKFEPKQRIKRTIEKEIKIACDLLIEARENAENKNSLEAIKYIEECENELRIIQGQMNQHESISDILNQIRRIQKDANLIAQQQNFDDDGNNEETMEEDTKVNYYDILEVDRDSSIETIKKSYIALVKKYHPDKYEHLAEEYKLDAERKFKKINEAYRVLVNPESKAKYDKTI